MTVQSVSQNEPADLRRRVSEILSTFTHFTLRKNLTTLQALQQCTLLDGVLHLGLQMPFAWQSGFEALQQAVDAELRASIPAITAIEWLLRHDVARLRRANSQPAVTGVRNIIAVSSGKGGVGKSTTAVNLALALSIEGAKVGILDADIYGPSIPLMLGSAGNQPSSPDGRHMMPVEAHQLATNSIGYLESADQGVIWRGPMASKALLQLLRDTLWPDLDYLIIDMPPGTGDIQLTLAQNIPVTGAIIVTTPQDLALSDVIKGLSMFQKVVVPVLGVVENMSMHICSHCGHKEAIFGSGGAQQLVEKYDIRLLAQLPLHRDIREDLDSGCPTVINRPDGELTKLYRQLAAQAAAELYWIAEPNTAEILVRQLD